MKKIISALLSAAISISSLSFTTGSAETRKTAEDTKSARVVVLGDGIAAGATSNGSVQYSYADIIGDYLGCKTENLSAEKNRTDDLLSVIDSFSEADRSAVAGAEIIVISAGGTDMLTYGSKKLLDFAARKGFLNEGYTADNLPENPSLDDLMVILNLRGEGGLFEYAGSGFAALREVNDEIGEVFSNLRFKNDRYEGYIETHIIPNIKEAVTDIKAINPDARIIVQNIYQPLQFQPEYLEDTYGSFSSQETLINQLRHHFEVTTDTFSTQLAKASKELGVETVDIRYEFTSLESDPTAANPGHASYFVDIQTGSLSTMEVRPNQKGHLAIAAAILAQIGELHYDTGLFSQVYGSLADKSDYPAIAYSTYKKVAGDPSMTTTTTTTVTTTTTTTTTKTTTTTTKATTSSTTSKATTTTSTTSKTTSKTTSATTTTTTAATTTAATTTTTAPKPAYTLGDVNEDGLIDAVDASMALEEYARQSSKQEGLLSAKQRLAADADRNGIVDAVDASQILAYYAYASSGSGEKLPFEEYLKQNLQA